MYDKKHIEADIDEYLNTYFGSEQEKQIHPFLKKMALHYYEKGKEIGKKEIIDKACEWIKHYQEHPNHDISAEALIIGFRKYMES